MSTNRMIKAEALRRLKSMGYKDSDARIVLAKSFRQLREAWIERYGVMQ